MLRYNPYTKKTLSKKVCQNAGLKFLNRHLPSFPICFPSKIKATLLFIPSNTSDIIFLFYSILPTVFPTVQHSHIALICSKILELNSVLRTVKAHYLGEQAQNITSFLLYKCVLSLIMAQQQSQLETTASARLFMTSSTDHTCA